VHVPASPSCHFHLCTASRKFDSLQHAWKGNRSSHSHSLQYWSALTSRPSCSTVCPLQPSALSLSLTELEFLQTLRLDAVANLLRCQEARHGGAAPAAAARQGGRLACREHTQQRTSQNPPREQRAHWHALVHPRYCVETSMLSRETPTAISQFRPLLCKAISVWSFGLFSRSKLPLTLGPRQDLTKVTRHN